MNNKLITLRSRPKGLPTSDNFELKVAPVNQAEPGQIVIRSIYFSVDPYMRGRMNDSKSYVAPYQLNEPIIGGVIGEVIESQSEQFKVGDKVIGYLGWQLYHVVDATAVRKVDENIAPLSTYLSVLGMTGLTAYFGLMDIGKPKAGETVVVSGAAGSVGSIVGQIAKIQGTRVVGIAGSDEKTKLLVDKFGFDAAVNYKTSPNLKEAIAQACPNGVDIYFDNVGGDVSDAVMNLLNDYARIPLCGAISAYNIEGEDLRPSLLTKLIKTRSMIKGFVLGDYADRLEEGTEQLAKWFAEGKLQYEETIVEGFERLPEALLELFKGTNVGKMLVKVSASEV